jgi:hypothetical protein
MLGAYDRGIRGVYDRYAHDQGKKAAFAALAVMVGPGLSIRPQVLLCGCIRQTTPKPFLDFAGGLVRSLPPPEMFA